MTRIPERSTGDRLDRSGRQSGAAATHAAVELRAIAAFEQRFRTRPCVIASAPGRVNLIGDHTDYAGGLVLPMALAERTAVALAPAVGPACTLASLEMDASVTVESVADFTARPLDHKDAWINLVMGPLRTLRERLRADSAIEIPGLQMVVASDVPIGAGVSSSAALTTAVATAVLRWLDRTLAFWEVVDLLREAEERYAGTPCGIMDMTVALAADPGSALLIDCGARTIARVELPLQLAMFLVDSGVRHALGRSAYAERRRELAAADREPRFAPRARHVASESARVCAAVRAMSSGNLLQLGDIAFASHESLRDDYAVTVPEVDRIVDRIRAKGRAHGVVGARMTGGGFGGSVIVFADQAKIDAARAFLEQGVRAGVGVHLRRVRTGQRYTADFERELP